MRRETEESIHERDPIRASAAEMHPHVRGVPPARPGLQAPRWCTTVPAHRQDDETPWPFASPIDRRPTPSRLRGPAAACRRRPAARQPRVQSSRQKSTRRQVPGRADDRLWCPWTRSRRIGVDANPRIRARTRRIRPAILRASSPELARDSRSAPCPPPSGCSGRRPGSIPAAHRRHSPAWRSRLQTRMLRRCGPIAMSG